MIASDEVVSTSAAPSAVISSIAIMAMSSATPCSRRMSTGKCRVSEVRLHSAGDASLLHPNAAAALGAPGLAALLVGPILPMLVICFTQVTPMGCVGAVGDERPVAPAFGKVPARWRPLTGPAGKTICRGAGTFDG